MMGRREAEAMEPAREGRRGRRLSRSVHRSFPSANHSRAIRLLTTGASAGAHRTLRNSVTSFLPFLSVCLSWMAALGIGPRRGLSSATARMLPSQRLARVAGEDPHALFTGVVFDHVAPEGMGSPSPRYSPIPAGSSGTTCANLQRAGAGMTVAVLAIAPWCPLRGGLLVIRTRRAAGSRSLTAPTWARTRSPAPPG